MISKNRAAGFLKYLFFLFVGLGLLWYVFHTQAREEGIEKLLEDIRKVDFFWIFFVIFLYMLSNISRAVRWNMLVLPLGYKVRLRNSFMAIMVGQFMNSVITRSGELARPGIIKKYEKVPLDQLVGTIVTDRVVDVLCLSVFVALGFFFEFDTLWGYISEHALRADRNPGGVLLLILLAALSVMVPTALLYVYREKWVQHRFGRRIMEIILGFWQGIKTIRRVKNPGWFVFHSIFIWVMYFSMMYFCFRALPPTAHLGPMVGLIVFIFGTLGIIIPSPGGIGSFQFLVTTALATFYQIGSSDAFSFSNIIFFSIYFTNIGVGFLCFILLPLINKNYLPHGRAPATAQQSGVQV